MDITQELIDKCIKEFDGTCPFSWMFGECSLLSVDECKKCLAKDKGFWLNNNFYAYNKMTCNTCAKIDICEYAYDPYNIMGDCLAIK